MGLDVVRAREKLHRKGVDAIVLNDITRTDLGFDSDRNAGIFLTSETEINLQESSKDAFASAVLDQIPLLRSRSLVAR
jgi:phosphopantothenoylcysteine decarboxylase/phosphopantothenate--cysteine ligase